MAHKNIPQFHKKHKSWSYRTFLVNSAYLAILSIDKVKGGYSAWGNTKIDAIQNVMSLAGEYVNEI